MGKILPKTLLIWKEPEHVRHAREAAEKSASKPWARPLGVLVLAIVILVPWALATLFPVPGRTPLTFPQALALALSFGLFMVYALPQVYNRLSSHIRITENGLMQGVANQVCQWAWGEIEAFQVRAFGSEDRSGWVIVVTPKLGSGLVFGIAPEVSLDAIEKIFRDHGVHVLPREELMATCSSKPIQTQLPN